MTLRIDDALSLGSPHGPERLQFTAAYDRRSRREPTVREPSLLIFQLKADSMIANAYIELWRSFLREAAE